jgi:hypothetical protein
MKPVAVTIDRSDDVFFWSSVERAVEFVKVVGGRVETIPEDVEDDDDEWDEPD